VHPALKKIIHNSLKRDVCRTVFIAWFINLFVFSSIPGSAAPQLTLLIGDKIAHAGYFALGSSAFMLTLLQNPSRHYSMPIIFSACMAMALVVGVFDEWHQTFTPNRHGNSLGDILANLAGGALGFCAGLWAKKLTIKPHDLATKQ